MEKKNNLVMEKGNFIHGKPKKIRIVEILEIETEITDDSILMPKRTIKEFWTLDNQYIGRIDPLDNYLQVCIHFYFPYCFILLFSDIFRFYYS